MKIISFITFPVKMVFEMVMEIPRDIYFTFVKRPKKQADIEVTCGQQYKVEDKSTK
ncbi:MAG: hypothetical protein HQK76_15240 [Desulfobacterales bacterium]|nr:hypothetical protein [Desulfobacterales bacterium]